MDKKIFVFFIIGILIEASFVTSAETDNEYSIINNNFNNLLYDPPDEMDQKHTYFSGFSWGCPTGKLLAQSFKPSLNILTRVKIRLRVVGIPEGLRISIRDDLNGSDLVSIYKDLSDMNIIDYWLEYDFLNIVLIPEKTYYIVWDPRGVYTSNNSFFWDMGDGDYDRGNGWEYGLGDWFSKGSDFCFITYGFSNSPPDKPNIPSGSTTGEIGDILNYEAYLSDSDGDEMNVIFDWGDNTDSGWIELAGDGTIESSHSWDTNGIYMVKVKARDQYLEGMWSESLTVVIGNIPPFKPSTPSGEISGRINIIYYYSSESTDPNDDNLYYMWDWGDDTSSDWIGPMASGESVNISHKWSSEGSFNIKVKAKDADGAESEWSDPLSITMPKNKISNNLMIEWLLSRFPILKFLYS